MTTRIVRCALGASFLLLSLAACERRGGPAPVYSGEGQYQESRDEKSAAAPPAPSVSGRQSVTVGDLAPPSGPGRNTPIVSQPLSPPPKNPAPAQAPAAAPVQTPAAALPAPGGDFYAVKAGDTVYGVSRNLNVSVRALIEANDLKAPFALNVGQNLKIPKVREHVVAKGETLYAIARQYNVSARELAALNDFDPVNGKVILGQRLRLPGGEAAKPSAPTVAAPSVAAPSVAAPAVAAPAPPSGNEAKALAIPEPAAPEPARAEAAAPAPAKAAMAIPKPPARSGSFAWPAKGKLIGRYGPLGNGRQNDGINIALPKGAPVKAAENGVVVYVGTEIRGYGNLILVKHEGGYTSAYAHTDKVLVKKGDRVAKGQEIGKAGASGNVTSPQLHFEIRKGTRPVNPLTLLGRGAA